MGRMKRFGDSSVIIEIANARGASWGNFNRVYYKWPRIRRNENGIMRFMSIDWMGYYISIRSFK